MTPLDWFATVGVYAGLLLVPALVIWAHTIPRQVTPRLTRARRG